MSNSKVVIVNTAPTSIAIANVADDAGDVHLVPVLFADGAAPIMIPVSVIPEKADQFLQAMAMPLFGDMLLARLVKDKGLGQIRPELVAGIEVVAGPIDVDSNLVADEAVATNVDTGEVTHIKN